MVEKNDEKFETEWKEVVVQDASKVEKVTKVDLVDAIDIEEKWEQTVLDKKVTFKAAEYENILGEKNTDKDENGNYIFTAEAPKVVSAKSSDVTTAYFADGVINVLKDGEVTFEVEFEGIEEGVSVPVTVKSEQKLSSIKTDTVKVKSAVESNIEIIVLDEDGEVYLGDDNQVYISTKTGTKDEEDAIVKNITEGKIEFKYTFEKGITTVNVYKDADKKESLGSFNIEAIDIKGNPDAYELKLAKDQKAILDLKENGNNKEVILDAKAFIDEVEVDIPSKDKNEDYYIAVKSSNDNITAELADKAVTVKVKDEDKAKAGDKATIQLVLLEGSKETKVGETVEIEVINTTFQVETLTLKIDEKVEVKMSKDGKDIISTDEELTAAVLEVVEEAQDDVEEDKRVDVGMIEKVTPVISNKKVLVKIADINGGKVIGLAAKFTTDATTIEPGTPVNPEEDTEAPVITTDAVDTEITETELATFELPTATANDNVDGDVDVTTEVKINGEVKTLDEVKALTADSTFVVVFTAKDAAENEATKEITYTVVADAVEDTEAPVITTDAVDTEITETELATFELPTATANDNVDGDVDVTTEVKINGEVKTLDEVKALTADSTFVVVFTAKDAAENEATKEITYTVVADA